MIGMNSFFSFFAFLPDCSGIGELYCEDGFLSLVILNWIEDLNFADSMQERDSRFRENDKREGNDKMGGNDKEDGNDKTFFVILNSIGDLYYENGFVFLVILPDESGIGDLNFEDSMQERDSRFRGNDKGGENDKREERKKGDSRFHGNDKGGENDKGEGNDKGNGNDKKGLSIEI